MFDRFRRSALLRSALAGVAGFLVYGGWAWWVNRDYGDAGIRAGLVQGSYSFLLTLGSTLMMEWVYRQLRNTAWPVVTTTMLTAVVLFATAYGIHLVAGTPMILPTILPGFIFGTLYSAIYVTSLAKLSL